MAVLEVYNGSSFVEVPHIKTQSMQLVPLVDRQRTGLGKMRQDTIGYKRNFNYTTNPITKTEVETLYNSLISTLFGATDFRTDRYKGTTSNTMTGFFSLSEQRTYASGSNQMFIVTINIEEE
jgi:hypothetical protein